MHFRTPVSRQSRFPDTGATSHFPVPVGCWRVFVSLRTALHAMHGSAAFKYLWTLRVSEFEMEKTQNLALGTWDPARPALIN